MGACNDCGRSTTNLYPCRVCEHHHCQECHRPAAHDCPALEHDVNVSNHPSNTQQTGTAERVLRSPSPDVGVDGSIKREASVEPTSGTRRGWRVGLPTWSGVVFRLRSIVSTGIALVGFGMIFYGMWSAFSTYQALGGVAVVGGESFLPQLVGYDMLLIFLGASIVIFATK